MANTPREKQQACLKEIVNMTKATGTKSPKEKDLGRIQGYCGEYAHRLTYHSAYANIPVLQNVAGNWAVSQSLRLVADTSDYYDEQAAGSKQAINAKAYTVGHDIAFELGQYLL